MKIAKEGWPLVAVPLVGGLAAWWFHPLASLPFLAALLFTLWFFRDPHRRTPEDSGRLFSPADGKIIKAGPHRVSIFMNVFNVHVCRAPMAGGVESVDHRPGRFMAAFHDHASEQNERTVIDLDGDGMRLRFTLVAGLIARRIVCRLSEGQRLRAGERVGLIRFGSRVDVELPPGAEVEVEIGQRVVAGETPIARLARVEGPAEGDGTPGREAGPAQPSDFRYSGARPDPGRTVP